jgi:hypothetical protein
MGVFTERGCEARFFRLAPSASIPARGRKLYFVLTGDGRVGRPGGSKDQSKDQGQAYRRYTTVSCDRGERAVFEAEAPTEILVLGLPKLESSAHYSIAAE